MSFQPPEFALHENVSFVSGSDCVISPPGAHPHPYTAAFGAVATSSVPTVNERIGRNIRSSSSKMRKHATEMTIITIAPLTSGRRATLLNITVRFLLLMMEEIEHTGCVTN